jgi:hypothetical protein
MDNVQNCDILLSQTIDLIYNFGICYTKLILKLFVDQASRLLIKDEPVTGSQSLLYKVG